MRDGVADTSTHNPKGTVYIMAGTGGADASVWKTPRPRAPPWSAYRFDNATLNLTPWGWLRLNATRGSAGGAAPHSMEVQWEHVCSGVGACQAKRSHRQVLDSVTITKDVK